MSNTLHVLYATNQQGEALSLASYQRELSLMIASPARRRAVAADPSGALTDVTLSERERQRLYVFSRHRGMVVNTALYRGNRLSPICNVLPWTCEFLGPRFSELVHEYWHGYALQDLQFPSEAARFAGYLKARSDQRLSSSPVLFPLLALELARYELALLPQRQIRNDVTPARRRAVLHPLVRIIRFPVDPTPILNAARVNRSLLEGLQSSSCAVLLDARTTSYSETTITDGTAAGLEQFRTVRAPRARTLESDIDKQLLVEFRAPRKQPARA
jgi:hypothetical protein